MSLTPRESDGGSDVHGRQKEAIQRKTADIYKENFSKAVIRRRLQEAEYKQSIGLDLSPAEEFVLQNKHFFKKVARQENI